MIEEQDNANCIHAFNRFEGKGYVEYFQCHFRLADIPCDVLYALATSATQKSPCKVSRTLLNFYGLNEIIKRLFSTSLMWAK